MKQLLLLVFVVLWVGAYTNQVYANDGDGIPLEIFDENPAGGGNTKAPRRPLIVYQYGYELNIPSFGCDFSFQILSGRDAIYSELIPAGTTSLQLPSSLSGSYEIRLLMGTYYFRGYITLY
jgi:hypothetical protein